MTKEEIKCYTVNMGLIVHPSNVEDDKGIYLYASNTWMDIQETKDLIKVLNKCLEDLGEDK